jgi:Ca2+-binding RTX toxin-like protein
VLGPTHSFATANDGDDSLDGRDGDDALDGGAGNDTLEGGSGADNLNGGSGDDETRGGNGNDRIFSASGADLINGDSGSDVLQFVGSSTHTVEHVAFNVSLDTQVGTQTQISLEGFVRIEAVIDGGADADIVQLSVEGDAFFLHDAYSGFHSSVSLTEDDVGNESAARFANIEEIRGLGGNDIIDLTSPDYSLAGVTMAIDGGEGNDVIWGSDANENIFGGNGCDTIFGGIGTGVLTGDLGADVFEFIRTSTDTSVTDFDVGEGDALRFYNAGRAEFDASSVALVEHIT